MEFRIADTFTKSLHRLPAKEQKAAKTTAFDLQIDPRAPGLRFHRVDRSRDKDFWTVRVNDDLRIVVHKSDANFLLCYVAHHDEAYAWAERRRIEVHPATGAAQFVELVHHVVEEGTFTGPPRAHAAQAQTLDSPPTPLQLLTDEVLLSYGVPPDWIPWIKDAGEDALFDLEPHLPAEAFEALLERACGGQPAARPVATEQSDDPFAHPDAQRRFRVVTDLEELKRALEFPWERWTVFLHPSQRDLVERRFNGPARVTGSAGTGKTVVALHRAVHLARTAPDARVLLATFSNSLAHALRIKLGRLVDPQDPVAARITVTSVDAVAAELYQQVFGVRPTMASGAQVETALRQAAEQTGALKFSQKFLLAEWHHVVDAWQLRSWEAYRNVARLGRKMRIGGQQREVLWRVFERAQAHLRERNQVTSAEATAAVTAHFRKTQSKPFTHAVIDEAQDVNIPQLRFLATIVPSGPDTLFFAGDLGQRIFQRPYSWLSQGVDVRGRSSSLKVNYRTSHQIRQRADVLLPLQVRDVDGVEDSRKGIISVFDGAEPTLALFQTEAEETERVRTWITDRIAEGVLADEIGVFVRTSDQLDRARAAIETAGERPATLDDRGEAEPGLVSLATMHLAKGLEFKAVVVMACDEDVIPLEDRLEATAEESDLAEAYQTERHLLYVACTRARDHLLVTGLKPGSEFLEDMRERAADRSV